jgi:hypothetical protein
MDGDELDLMLLAFADRLVRLPFGSRNDRWSFLSMHGNCGEKYRSGDQNVTSDLIHEIN